MTGAAGHPADAIDEAARRCIVVGVALALVLGCDARPAWEEAAAPSDAATHVGAAVCKTCHADASQAWASSHHALAMQEATAATVLGDFDSATFEAGGVTTRFARDGDAFTVETQGADGTRRTYPIAFTFGVSPLQQYLLETARGRLQAFGIAWDARANGRGWFHLRPDAAGRHADPLHWTQPSQNWNSMCADCHATGVRKHYDGASDTFATTYAEPNVGCEACHGPGSAHVEAPATPYGGAAGDIDTCAPCHSRRAQLAEGFRPGERLLDFYMPAAVTPPLYHADGQILEEVYVWGSFLQSRMHQQGVTCSDCHDPHSTGLRREGDALCTECHAPTPPPRFPTLAARAKPYDDAAHHFHTAVRCVDCHMPSRTYMGVDARRDHGFPIPRPDLSLVHGVPNACTGCHQDRDDAWAAAAIRRHTEAPPTAGVADVLALATTGRFDAEVALAAAAVDPGLPGIVRRSALLALGSHESPRSGDAIWAGTRDADPLVRLGASERLERLRGERRHAAVMRLLRDPVKAVRVAAAPAAAAQLQATTAPAERALIEAALDEYRATLAGNAERADAHTNLASLRTALGDLDGARAALGDALAREPDWIPALVNLADLHRAAGRDAEGGPLLARAVAVAPSSSEAAYAYGLWFIRQGQPARGLEQLRRAHDLAPRHLRNGYVLALALNAAGESDQAIAMLERALARFGGHRVLLVALATFHRQRGELAAALGYAVRLRDAFGAAYANLVAELRAARRAAPAGGRPPVSPGTGQLDPGGGAAGDRQRGGRPPVSPSTEQGLQSTPC